MDSTDTQRKKQKRGRGYTRKEEFWAKERKEKIKLEFNEFGQPIGDDAKELPSVIGMLVRTKGFPLCYDDWREVDVDKKLKIIEILECVFELDEEGEEYILASAAKKWRDFKSDLIKENIPQMEAAPRMDPIIMSEEHEEGREDDDNELESNYPREEEDQIFTNRRVAVPPTRDEEGGKEVLLISLIGASNTRVAKATVQTTDPRAIVGGTALGMQCSEVVVNFVMRRDAPLFRPYGKMETMADAVGQSIAWPNKKMVDVQQFKRSSHHSLGSMAILNDVDVYHWSAEG
ncbi:hypothetical protein ACP70R_007654 [Stipagrostis hirtigluma subsp. patula]